MKDCLAAKTSMSGSGNKGGYLNSDFKTKTGTNSLSAIRNRLPSEWRSIIKYVNKKSANGGGSNYTETLTSSEGLFMLSEIELCGTSVQAHEGYTEGTGYEYWIGKSGSDRIKKLGIDGSAQGWWLRSVRKGGTTDYVEVDSYGRVTTRVAYNTNGISLAFCV